MRGRDRSGRTDDFSEDHELVPSGKRFHRSHAYPALDAFVSALPDLVNFRVNVLGPAARLAAHEEHALSRTPGGSVGACVRAPPSAIVTASGAEVILDGRRTTSHRESVPQPLRAERMGAHLRPPSAVDAEEARGLDLAEPLPPPSDRL